MKNLFIAIVAILTFLGCDGKKEDKITVVTNSWIGYIPLFYAKERGYLEDLDIKLVTTVSLGEASEIFRVGKADMVTTTQHECFTLKQTFKSLVPVMLIDRSDGGDMILSNRTIEELKNSKKIYVYLEVDSINKEIFDIFVNMYNFDKNKFIYINGDQAQLQGIEFDYRKPTIVITYTPYDNFYLKKGFKEIANTKNLNGIVVIDALCTTKEFLKDNFERLKKFKKIIDKSVDEIEADKKESYKLVKRYLNDISYREFLDSLSGIKWINHASEELLNRIDKLGYDRTYILK